MRTWILVLLAVVWLSSMACSAQDALVQEGIHLSGGWKFSVDIPNAGLAKAWHMPEYDDSSWRTINVPGDWESQGITQVNPNWDQADDLNQPYTGYAWYRRTVNIPEDWEGKDIYIRLGRIDDKDWVYLNGKLIGQTLGTGAEWVSAVERKYELPEDAIRFGQPNLIAVRMLDMRGLGGIVDGPVIVGHTDSRDSQVAPSGRQGHDIVKVGSSVKLSANEVAGDIVLIGGNLTLDGHARSVVVIGGNVKLEHGSRVDGDVTVLGGRLDKSSDATIGGITTDIRSPFNAGRVGMPFLPFAASFLGSLLFAVLAALIVALFPASVETITEVAFGQPGKSSVYGIVGLLLAAPVAFFLLITCIGIPLIVVEVFALIAAWIIGTVGVSLGVGRRVSTAINRPVSSAIWAAVLGVVIIAIVKLVPFAGGLAAFILSLIGFGAVLSTKFGTEPDWWNKRRRT